MLLPRNSLLWALPMAAIVGADIRVVVPSSKVSVLMSRLRSLPHSSQRAVAAVVGSAVGDAAARPMHWLYDRLKLESIVGGNDPAFWPESISPYYILPTGRRSCYNDLGYCLLRSLPVHTNIAGGIHYDQSNHVRSLSDMFKSPSEYSEAFERRKTVYDPSKRLEDRQPVPGPWQQGAVSVFLGRLDQMDLEAHDGQLNLEAFAGINPDSKETDGLCTAIPLIARLATRDLPPEACSELIRQAASVLSTNEFAMKHTLAAGRILRKLIQDGGSQDQSSVTDQIIAAATTPLVSFASVGEQQEDLTDIITELEQVRLAAVAGEIHTDAVERFGKPCANPGSFMGALLAVMTSSEGGFAEGIRKVTKAGGCNCSRANLAGACLGALYGFDGLQTPPPTEGLEETSDTMGGDGAFIHGGAKGIPLRWLLATDKGSEIFELALERVAPPPG